MAGETLELGQDPFVHQNRTYVPLRAIFEKLGAEVAWDGSTQTVTATKGDVVVEMTMNSKTAYRNEAPVELDAAPMIRDNRVYVPVRFIAESFNNPVKWVGATNTVQIEASNRARMEELLNGSRKDVRSGHIYQRVFTMTLEDGQKSEGLQEVEGDYVRLADGLHDVHFKVQRSGDFEEEGNSYEIYAKGERVYVAFNGFDTWLTSLRDNAPNLITTSPFEKEPGSTSTAPPEIVKHATLHEDGPYDVVTFHYSLLQFLKLSEEQYGDAYRDIPVKMSLEFEKGTQRIRRMAYDFSVENNGYGYAAEYLEEYSKYDELTEITVPAHVLKAEETDLSQSE